MVLPFTTTMGEMKEIIFDQILGSGYSIISITKSTEKTLVCLQDGDGAWSLKVVDRRGHILRTIYTYNWDFRVIPPVFFPLLQTDLEGNVYVHNNYYCLRITKDGYLEKFKLPETEIADLWYDANIDMLVCLCSEFLIFKSPKVL